jgi:signal transduction histidine kinase
VFSTSLRERLRRGADVAIPCGTALFLASLVQGSNHPVPGPVRLAGMGVGAAQGVVLLWRRSHPRAVMAATVVGGAAVQVIAPYGLFPYAGIVAMWTLAMARRPWESLTALVALLGVTALGWPAAKPGDVPFAMAVVVSVWSLAQAARGRRLAIAHASRQAAAQEQARLARELHDVIAHSVSVIVVQAAAADDVFDRRPDQARTALRAIEAAGREAMAELRRLLTAIGPSGETGDGRLAPAPGLDRIAELAGPLRAAGLAVDVRREDDGPVTVPPGVGLSAYRIVQEALTNALRHAEASRVEVRVRTDENGVEVSVQDDGQGGLAATASHGAGHGAGRGIAGMRERAAILGGTLEVGPRPGGGFGVRALLPLQVPR